MGTSFTAPDVSPGNQYVLGASFLMLHAQRPKTLSQQTEKGASWQIMPRLGNCRQQVVPELYSV